MLQRSGLDLSGKENPFYVRFLANIGAIHQLYTELYRNDPQEFSKLLQTMIEQFRERTPVMREHDEKKAEEGVWFLSNHITGMSLYVDRFAGNLSGLQGKLPYFEELGVNLLHIMPIFESPEGESDGGYAVSNFRKVDSRFGSAEDLRQLRSAMDKSGMYLMLDIVMNHTSHKHVWAEKARAGAREYQDYYYMYDDRSIPDEFEKTMPEIFPDAAPGNFTYVPEAKKWVMTVFHRYQWDLNYTNPVVFREMLDNILFFANLGVDILRIDAPAFVWKQIGTTCQNLPQAHTLLRLIKQCVQVVAPGMAILGEAIVAPSEIMKYFGTGTFTARECDVAYNATHMALQWDALATGNTGVMMAAQFEILQKPFGTTWINYTRCHDDIGLGFEDDMIRQAGNDPALHRQYLKDYYSGQFPNSPATGALFGVNPKTGDARISGTLASLCGLEKALNGKNQTLINTAIQRLLMMQAHSLFLGGLPMIFYGDEAGYTNDYSYLKDPGKSYDNRWMHRPVIDWGKNAKRRELGTVENLVFEGTRKLISIRGKLRQVADLKNLSWIQTQDAAIAAYVRNYEDERAFFVFNFSDKVVPARGLFSHHGKTPPLLNELWSGKVIKGSEADLEITLKPYEFGIFVAGE